FELKLSLCLGATRLVDQYEELTDERAIKKALDMEIDNDLSSQLEALGYKPFCVCTTTRLKHKNGEFIIDLDKVDFQDFNYYIGEIEVMVNTKEEVGSAIDNILVYAKQLGLMIAPVRGKVIEYLKRKRPNHYQKLISAGVVFDHE
ncbi:MAG: CYTH domain-containing protein, partial [Patescibacteria group bacterium]